MFEPKVPAVGAAIGFVLSFLVGIVAGASFSVLLIRAIIMALLFGGLAFGGKLLVLKYLPELMQQEEGPSSGPLDQGTIVDITLGGQDKEDNPFSNLRDQHQDDMVPDFLMNSEKNDLEPGPEPDVQTRTPQEGFQPTPFLGASINEANTKHEAPESAKKGHSGGLDVLPDLDDFVPHAIDEGVSNKDEDEVSQGTGERRQDTAFSAAEGKPSSVESETMVKAIRTILTRDT